MLLALALVVGLAVAHRDRQRLTAADEPVLTAGDEADLVEQFAAAQRDSAHTFETLLLRRLHTVLSRRVPLRAIRTAPGRHTGRLVFGNGTVLLARARRPGDLYVLAMGMTQHSICLDSWRREPDGTVLHFRWDGGAAQLLALGLDQAD